MPEYMLLLYAPEADEAERAERWAEMPLWDEVNESLQEAGVLAKYGPLHSVATATTVRLRGDETELTDGPFAVTKEVLVGYYVLDCADLDQAVGHAPGLPPARGGEGAGPPAIGPGALARAPRGP